MHLFDDRTVRVLDLFSGTGSIGVEALSRGASECIFVDGSKECVDCSIANAWLAGFMDKEEAAKGSLNERIKAETAPMMMVGGPRARVQMELHRKQVSRQPVGAIQGDVFKVLQNPEEYGLVGRTFNLIVASPPYNEVSYRQLCTALASTELLERDGLIALEYPRELGVLPPVISAPFEDPDDADDIASGVPMLYGLRNREYGSTILAIYIKLPTGARGSAGEPRPWEFTESLIQNKLKTRSRDLWRTPSLFADSGERGMANPKKAKRLNK
jgi:16S rRNA G966 N2-methylase RsmD